MFRQIIHNNIKGFHCTLASIISIIAKKQHQQLERPGFFPFITIHIHKMSLDVVEQINH